MDLRDAIEYIAQYCNFQYPGDVSMSCYLPHTCVITTLKYYFTILFPTYFPNVVKSTCPNIWKTSNSLIMQVHTINTHITYVVII